MHKIYLVIGYRAHHWNTVNANESICILHHIFSTALPRWLHCCKSSERFGLKCEFSLVSNKYIPYTGCHLYLGWPRAPSYMSPNAGGREGVAGPQPLSTAVHRSSNKLWRSSSIFNLWLYLSPPLAAWVERWWVSRRGAAAAKTWTACSWRRYIALL